MLDCELKFKAKTTVDKVVSTVADKRIGLRTKMQTIPIQSETVMIGVFRKSSMKH